MKKQAYQDSGAVDQHISKPAGTLRNECLVPFVRTSIQKTEQKIKQEYPYNARVYLEDEASALARRQELNNQLRDLKMRTARYETAIARMLDDEEENGERI